MPVRKRLLKARGTQMAASWILAQLIRLIFFTSRKTYHISEAAKPYMQGDKNMIFAFWHGRMMAFPPAYQIKRPVRVLISHHSDGLLISRVIGQFGIHTISGSTSRGGRQALQGALAALEAGDNISITPDGPRGPAQHVSNGTVILSKLSQVPMVPVTFCSTRYKCFNSWDRFMLALPFGHIHFYVGDPQWIDREANDIEEEAARLKLEQAMNQLVAEADAHAAL